ncbi:MAG: metallopeptidase family protein [Gemmatimonadetes bacterium]|nr:metallopeptidase family protein [Gemmatimonadota bacterium]
MTFEEFEQRAWQEWERIPAEYRAGVDGLRIERVALPHDSLHDVHTLGECVTESYPSEYGGPETTRSVVVLYYGSFFRLSRHDTDFDWEVELWETLTHELQHHLESLARDDSLVDMDYAADENYKRYQGEPFDPLFFRHGVPGADAWLRVEDEFFLELKRSAGAHATFTWHGRSYQVAVPAVPADVLILSVVDGVPDAPGALHVVLVERAGWLSSLLRLLRPEAPHVVERDVHAVAT